jgi:DNA polymerase-3 subunit alpha
MAFAQLEDLMGQVEIICFSKVYPNVEAALKSDQPLLVKGNLRIEGDEDSVTRKVRVDEVIPLSDVRRSSTRRVHVRVAAARLTDGILDALRDTFRRSTGSCELRLDVVLDDGCEASVLCGEPWRVEPSDELIGRVERLLGAQSVRLR